MRKIKEYDNLRAPYYNIIIYSMQCDRPRPPNSRTPCTAHNINLMQFSNERPSKSRLGSARTTHTVKMYRDLFPHLSGGCLTASAKTHQNRGARVSVYIFSYRREYLTFDNIPTTHGHYSIYLVHINKTRHTYNYDIA